MRVACNCWFRARRSPRQQASPAWVQVRARLLRAQAAHAAARRPAFQARAQGRGIWRRQPHARRFLGRCEHCGHYGRPPRRRSRTPSCLARLPSGCVHWCGGVGPGTLVNLLSCFRHGKTVTGSDPHLTDSLVTLTANIDCFSPTPSPPTPHYQRHQVTPPFRSFPLHGEPGAPTTPPRRIRWLRRPIQCAMAAVWVQRRDGKVN